jgi:hypothetical protein
MFALHVGPRQRKLIMRHGSDKLRSWVNGSNLRAPDAHGAWAHLSDVLHFARLDQMDTRSMTTITETALRQACKER